MISHPTIGGANLRLTELMFSYSLGFLPPRIMRKAPTGSTDSMPQGEWALVGYEEKVSD